MVESKWKLSKWTWTKGEEYNSQRFRCPLCDKHLPATQEFEYFSEASTWCCKSCGIEKGYIW